MRKIWDFIKWLSPFIGLSSLVLAIYINFMVPRNPEISLEALNNSTLIDIKDNYQKLTILYDSINILNSDEELRYILLKIKNTGNHNINLSHFDPNNPFGIKISAGCIVDVPQITTSTVEDLQLYLEVVQDSTNSFFFPAFLFDTGTYFTIKFLVLIEKDKPLVIRPFGKISGTNPIIINNSQNFKQEPNLLQTVFEGSLIVLLLKLVIFTIIGIGIILIFALFGSYIWNLIFPPIPYKSPGQQFSESREAHLAELIKNLKERKLQKGDLVLNKMEYLCSRYKDEWIGSLHNDLISRELIPESDEELTLRAIELLIEVNMARIQNGKFEIYPFTDIVKILREI